MITYLKKLFESKPYVPQYDLSYSGTILSGSFHPDVSYDSDGDESPYDTIEYGPKNQTKAPANIKTFTLPDGSVVAIDTEKTDMQIKSKLDI